MSGMTVEKKMVHRRNVCEDACASIPTSALEAGVIQKMVEFVKTAGCWCDIGDMKCRRCIILTKLEGM